MQLHDWNDADVGRIIQRLMAHLKDFASVRNLNNAQLKQPVEKIEAGKDGTADVCLRLFAGMEQVTWRARDGAATRDRTAKETEPPRWGRPRFAASVCMAVTKWNGISASF